MSFSTATGRGTHRARVPSKYRTLVLTNAHLIIWSPVCRQLTGAPCYDLLPIKEFRNSLGTSLPRSRRAEAGEEAG